jgi:hypothetical protein
MGSYSTLYVDGKEICSRKNELDQVLMTLFQVSERSLRRGSIEDIAPYLLDDDRANASEQIELLTYETTVSALKDRLDLMGFSIEFARGEYERDRKRKLEESKIDSEPFGDNPDYLNELEAKERALQELSFDRWLIIFEKFWNDKERWGDIPRSAVPTKDSSLDGLLMWYVSTQNYDIPYSFLSEDARLFLRAVCEILPPKSSVIYDLSELAYDSGDAQGLATFAEGYLDGGYATTRRIIVLTEGRTDQRAIEGALKLLRPDLANYFSFLDFDMLVVPGGVSSVLNTLKALISVGIANRVVALLDNDTAAHAAVQAVKLGSLPKNARIAFLPRLSSAENYPTLGPTGMTTMDINGLACSIELYFGADVLTQESGQLVPIQWKGYDERLKRYQGEIMHKADLQTAFSDKLMMAKEDPALLGSMDWTSMQMVIQSLVTAFHDLPPIDYELENVE